MTKYDKGNQLRDKAEEILRENKSDMPSFNSFSELVHELQTHQIELEMQNQELRKTSLDLEKEKLKYYNLYEFAPVGYFSLDENEIIKDVNLAGTVLLGIDKTEQINSAFIRFMNSESRRTFYKHLGKVKNTGIRQSCELILLKKDGKPFYANLETVLIQNNEAKEFRITVNDITKRVNAEEALKKKEIPYLTLFNSINEGFCTVEVIFDADEKPVDYRFLEVNPAFEGQTGLIDAEGELMRDLAPDHEEYWFQIYGKIALTGKPLRFVNEAKALNRKFDVYAFKIGDPESRKVAILFNDITKRKKIEDDLKKSEERYSLTVESVNEGIWEWNIPTGEAYFSPTYYKILGYDDREFPASYESFRSLIHPDDVESFEKELQHDIDNAEGYSLEIRLKTKDDKWRWILTNGKVVETGEDGKPLRMVGTHTDITNRKIAENVLKESEQRLSEIIEFLPDATFAIDNQGKVISWNRAVEEMTGLEADDILGKGNYEYALPFYGTRRPMLIDLVLKSELELEEKYSFVKKVGNHLLREVDVNFNGKNHSLWTKAVPLYDRNGKFNGAIESIRDITDRKKAEFALRKSEERFRAVAESAVDAIVTTDLNGVILFCNNSLGTIFGYSKEEIIGKNLTVLMPDRFKKYYTSELERFKVSGKHRRIGKTLKTRGLRKDGTEFPFEMSLSAWKTEKESYFTSIIRDITERTIMEDSLTVSEKKYRSIFENSGTAIFIVEDDLISEANAEAENLTGFLRDEMVGQKKWTDLVIKEEHERLKKDTIKRKIYPDSVPKDYETKIEDKYGTVKDVLVKISNIPGTEKFLISSIDITKRKKIEYKLYQASKEWERTFNAVPDLITIIDNDYHISRVNKGMADSLGVEPEASIGLICYEAVHGSNEPHILCPHRKLLDDGLEHTMEIHEERLGGDFIVSVSPLHDDEGNLIGSVHVARNINPLKNVEKDLRISIHQKDLLIKEIHHRVKNNLQIISSLLYLQEDYVKEDLKAVNVLQESQNRVSSMALLHEMLYQSEDLSQINFSGYVENLVSNLFNSYNIKNNITLIINVDNICLNMETAVPCGLIISELVSNSLKYAYPDDRNGELNISLQYLKNGLELIISDDGVGFPEDLDFRNIKSSLGLKLVNSLVKQLDGSIELDRSRGTEFKIKFKELKYKPRI